MGLFESVDEAFPPVVVLGQDYEGCEQPVTGGQTEWNLLEVDERPGSGPVVGVLDGRETVVCPASVDCCEGEREGCEGGRPNSEGDWWDDSEKIGIIN